MMDTSPVATNSSGATPDARPPWRRTIGAKLAGAFAAIMSLFAIALFVELGAFDRIAEAEAEVEAAEQVRLAAHRAGALVREQYMHQAHTIINGDDSHLDHYEDVAREARVATTRLIAQVEHADAALAEEVARLAARNDAGFHDEVLPAVLRGDRVQLRALHDRTAGVVDQAVEILERLDAKLEARASAARGRAAALRGRARWLTFGCFAAALLLAMVVGAVLVRAVVRPMSLLRDGARRVGQGDLGVAIAVSTRDEFDELASAFNRMTENLARHQRQLLASQRLASIGQVAAGVAHEINNPLGVILGYVKLMRRDASSADAEGLRIIEDETRQCQRIVRGLLDLARPPHLEIAAFDLAELARDAVERLDSVGTFEGRRVDLSGLSTPVHAAADEAKVRQVIDTLLSNAADATHAGDAITVSVERDGEGCALVVRDTGTGIAAEALPKVLDPFFTTKPNGLGLGLAIAQSIVDAHGGRLDVASGPDRGTRVNVSLPPHRLSPVTP